VTPHDKLAKLTAYAVDRGHDPAALDPNDPEQAAIALLMAQEHARLAAASALRNIEAAQRLADSLGFNVAPAVGTAAAAADTPSAPKPKARRT
jgi:hypothetical protein